MTAPASDPENMVYNQERLSRALQLFHISAPYRRKRGLRADNLNRHLCDGADKYQLRCSAGVAPASASLWLDLDDSGDYNPTGKQVSTVHHPPLKRKRVAAENREKELEGKNDGLKNKRAKVNTWIKGRQNGEQLLVTLKLKTDAGKDLLRKLDATESNKNNFWSDDDTGPSEWRQMGGRFSKRSSSTLQSYALRHKIGLASPGPEELGPLPGSDRRNSKPHGHFRTKKVNNQGSGDLLTPPSPADPILEISTSWAHPVNFRHIGSEDSPCDFCDDYRYGMLGLGKVSVEVRRLAGKVGFEELKGGHRTEGHAQTKMCCSCVLERLSIIRCSHQIIEALPDLDEDNFNFQKASQDLLATETDKKQAQTLWCSICISPAFYACLDLQKADMEGDQPAEWSEDSYGCGLVLCRDCAGTLDALNGNLEAAAIYFTENPNLRADFDFLLADSDLARTYDSDD